MKTRDAAQTVIAMARTAHRYDVDAYNLLMPDNLEDAQRLLSTACAIIDALTTGPKQDAVMDKMANLAEGFGDKEMP